MDKKYLTLFQLNGEPLKNAPFQHQDTLLQIRKALKLDEGVRFFKDVALDVEDEQDITLIDILEGKLVKLVRVVIEKELMEFDFVINGKKIRTESFNKEITLDKVRMQLNLNEQTKFHFGQLNMDLEFESYTLLIDMSEDGKTIQLQQILNYQQTPSPQKIVLQQVKQNQQQSPPPMEQIKSQTENNILTTFSFNNKPSRALSIQHVQRLSETRKLLKLEDTARFLHSGVPLDMETEELIQISQIVQQNEVKIQLSCNEIEFLLDGKLFAKHCIASQTVLSKVREEIKLHSTIHFEDEKILVPQKMEVAITLEFLLSHNPQVHLTTTLTNSQPIKREIVPPINSKLPEAQYFFSTGQNNELQLGKFAFDLKMFLIEVRKLAKLDDEIFFIDGNEPVLQKYEGKLELSEITKPGCFEIIVQDNRQKKIINKINKPIQGSQFIRKQKGLDIYQYPITNNINESDKILSKVIMVVGQTGSGKTTLLNSLVNYHMGIQFNDSFRYVVVVEDTGKSQAHSQTSQVNQYLIKAFRDKPSLIIVDTPGFGDTRGMQQDQLLVGLIKSFFDSQMDQVHAICFVAASSNARLTTCQKYIFNEVLKLFGRDIAENFVCMITFCDGSTPPILEGLTIKDSPFQEVKSLIIEPWYMQFNNSGVFEGEGKDSFQNQMTKMFWEISMHSFDEFYKLKIQLLPVKSLKLTKKVLKTRENLKIQIFDLNAKNNLLIESQQILNAQIINVKNNKLQIDANSGFDVVVTTPQINQINLSQGEYITNCMTCNRTCHYPCTIADDGLKKKCAVMIDGKCTVCIAKCDWSVHKNMSYRFKITQVSTTNRAVDVYKAYLDAQGLMTNSEKIILGLEKDLEYLKIEFSRIQLTVNNLVDRLKGSALRTGVLDSCDDYIDEMIAVYQDERKEGWQLRVQHLKDQKQYSKLLQETYNQKPAKGYGYGQYLDNKSQEVQKNQVSWYDKVITKIFK